MARDGTADSFAQVLEWMTMHAPASVRATLLSRVSSCHKTGGTADEMWRIVAETMAEVGDMDAARDALRHWQALAPSSHPLMGVLDAARNDDAPLMPPPPPPPPRPEPPITRREPPNTRIVRVINEEFTFQRVDPRSLGYNPQDVVACWTALLNPDDENSYMSINELPDGRFAPWSVSGLSIDMAGAAAVELVIRSLQRDFMFNFRKMEKTRRTLTNIALPVAVVIGLLVGLLLGLSK